MILVEPLHLVRAGLRSLVASEPGMEILGEAAGGDEAISVIRAGHRRRDVVVLVSLSVEGEHDAYWLIRSVRDTFPSLSILACGANVDGMTVSRALFAGADGFIHKNAQSSDFLFALREAAAGRAVLTGLPIDLFGEIADGLDLQRQTDSVLTEREREVIAVAAQGLTAREISVRLGVRERTVTTHLGNIYKKLGCRSRVSAVTTAQRSGLLTVAAG